MAVCSLTTKPKLFSKGIASHELQRDFGAQSQTNRVAEGFSSQHNAPFSLLGVPCQEEGIVVAYSSQLTFLLVSSSSF